MKRILACIILVSIFTCVSAAPRLHELSGYPAVFYNEGRADSAHGFNVVSYDITLTINDVTHYIDGSVEATVIAEDMLTEIIYELEQLEIDHVYVNGEPAGFSYNQHVISIELDSIQPGEEFTTRVDYSGYPVLSEDAYNLGIIFNPNYVFTLSDPSGCRWWWPAYDHPWDKAEVDFHVTMRDDWLVACNGLRTSIVDNDDGTKTHHWDGTNPMATFLASISAANYIEIEQNYGDLQILNFVTPGQYNNALIDFNNLPDMIGIYSNRYGEYPFEKYGNSVVPMVTFGAMEHQTMTTLGSYIITGTHQYETTITHELSHHWFGDCLTPLTWADVWLSEGFAVYSEAVFMEDFYNYDAMLDYVHSSIQQYYLSWSGGQNHTIYDPTFNNYFAPVSYEKAASVLHMLRNRVGSETFFDILQTYFLQYHNSNVVTEDFRQVCEDVSGKDLEQFFAQWIYGSGIPTYDFTWFVDREVDPPVLKTFVVTSSTSGTDYYLKIPVQIQYSDGNQTYLVDSAPDDGLISEIQLDPGEIVGVHFDPDTWILNRGTIKHIPQINCVYSSDSQVQISWDDFWNQIEIEGYNVYRSLTEDEGYAKLNDNPVLDNNYLDLSAENGITYYYKITAVLSGNFESCYSAEVVGTPFFFPLDQGILVVDETMDGPGSAGNPNDAQVDEFYNEILTQNYTSYDYNDMGAPDLEYMSHFSTIIWHDDDTPQHLINLNLENLGSYLLSGGNLIISGWKTANEIQEYFLDDFLDTEATMTSGFEFTSAISNSYPDLMLNEDNLSPAFNGTLPFVCIFPETDEGIYQFDAESGSTHQGEICAVKRSDPVNLVFLGFPLYYFQPQGAELFMTQLLQDLGETSSDDTQIPVRKLTCYAAPNPFNPETTIYFDLPQDSFVTLEIFNIKGQSVRRLIRDFKNAGQYNQKWDGYDNEGFSVASGIYYYRLDAGGKSLNRKLLLLK